MSSGNDALPIEVITEKLNITFEEIENKNKERNETKKALVTYGRQYRGRCSKCGKFGH